jgi:para-nitrobenzyl esterase
MDRRNFLIGSLPLVPAGCASGGPLRSLAARNVMVTTKTGAVTGSQREQTLQFRGIPYAVAERFRPPQPLRWSTPKDATAPGPIAPQNPSQMDLYIGTNTPLPQGEDCQRLSLWTPSLDGRRPVMVFIHGGAYVSGSGEDARYSGDRLAADGDVVVVNVSYRLGALGFACLPDLGARDLGLLDILAGLDWVRENCASFGGDPGNVTVFGQSAGAHAIATILARPRGAPFHKAILQSPPLAAPLSVAEAERVGASFLAALKTNPVEASVSEILEAQLKVTASGGRRMAFAPISPSFAPSTPTAGRGLILMSGWTLDDSAPFIALASGKPLSLFGSAAEKAATAQVTEQTFGKPARDFANNWSKAGADCSVYRFDWRPAGAPLGAGHCLELALLLGAPSDWANAPMLGQARVEQVQEIGSQLRKEWGKFARSGTGPAKQAWLARPDL